MLTHKRVVLTLMATVGMLGAWQIVRSQTEPVLQTARGRVFHDQNGNGRVDAGEPGLAGMRVSNGKSITQTDADGRYELQVTDDTSVFVIKPRGWRTPLNEHRLPQFYYLHKPQGSPPSEFPGVAPTGPLPESIDFALMPQEEPAQFKAILFGDPQPRDQKEVDYVVHDVVESLIGTDASFGVTLGDITFDNLALFEPQAAAIALIGIPWYNVIGNHDVNREAIHDRHSDESFERVFGPAYYSFDYGEVHFLVLDDVNWLVEDNGQKKYEGGLGADQMEFIRNDLALIPPDQMVVLMMHIPLEAVKDRSDLYRLIEQRPCCLSISAHQHEHVHRFITKKDGWRGPEPHHHIINVTVCGSWWSGSPDERGIPHATMADGAPNGYSILTFDGKEYTLDFRAAGRPADYQMEITLPEEVPADATSGTEVSVNVFNGSERSITEMRVVGVSEWTAMPYAVNVDRRYRETQERERVTHAALPKEEQTWRVSPMPSRVYHLWEAALPANLPVGLHTVEVRSTDMHGRTFESRRTFRVVATTP